MTSFAIGTAQFGMAYGIANLRGKIDAPEAAEILKLAKVNNIETIDTAITYGDSEQCLGSVGVHNFKLITKLPSIPSGCIDVCSWIFEQIQSSLMRLKVNSLYGILLHQSKDLLSKNGKQIYKALIRLKEAGITQKIGISIYSPEDLDLIIRSYKLDIVQAPLNLIDRRLIDSGWLNQLKDLGYEVHVRSVFLQGLLLMDQNNRPSKFSRWDNIWDEWHSWGRNQKLRPIEACLFYVLSFPEVDKVIVGMDGLKQFQEIIESIKCYKKLNFPSIGSNDELLLNPSKWGKI